MSLGHYRLLAQVAANADGVSYRARAEGDGGLVEVRALAGARADALRWPALSRQLRLAQLLVHPSAIALRDLALDEAPPYLVLDWEDGPTLAESLGASVPLPVAEAVPLALALCGALRAAHRFGLAHGRLSPDAIRLTPLRVPRLDFTDTDPRLPSAAAPSPPGDVAALGVVFGWLLMGEGPRSAGSAHVEGAPLLTALLHAMLANDPTDRPLAREVEWRLGAFLSSLTNEHALGATNADLLRRDDDGLVSSTRAVATRDRLGRFLLLEKLGAGGMGEVYRAEDMTDGRVVAIKVLRPELIGRGQALRRFHKEARLLAEVNNPYVANLLEVNEDDGIHYLALEFVAGRSLAELTNRGRPLDERFALAVCADTCRALVDAHARGIIHRDVKPENILLIGPSSQQADGSVASAAKDDGPWAADEPIAKLADFGLARHAVEEESLNLTRTGAGVGTPLYLSPEQCAGARDLGPSSDVYSIGATLFHMLAGRPPFLGDGPLKLITQHCNEAPPPLERLVPSLREGTCRLVEKALAKKPEHRHASAAGLLADVERLLRGEPSSLGAHPRLPACDPGRVQHFDFSWKLGASPEQLWPFVSNTERLNRAIHLSAVDYETRPESAGGARRFAKMRKLGIAAAWQEHPFEWIEARRFGVLREFAQGPFKWLLSVVDLAPLAGGGTALAHRFRIEPTGLVGRTLAAVEVGLKTKRALERVYKRIDAALTGKLGGGGLADPFEEPAALSRAQRRRLDEALEKLMERGVAPALAEKLGDFLALAPPQEVARIRPLALARRLGLDAEQVVAACLHGARAGLFLLLWDLLCPICRIPAQIADTLRAVRDHGRCEACNRDFELDFASSVELIFRASPSLRDAELGTYCIGGPAHSPHVVAQVRIAPGERVELALDLGEGAYRLRGPQLPAALDFRVEPALPGRPGDGRWEVHLAHVPVDLSRRSPHVLHVGGQVLTLTGSADQELLVRVERTAARDDALTAARASALALFRELFPGEVLAPGQLVSVATVTLLVTEVEGAAGLYERLGEAKAFAFLHVYLRALEGHARAHGGALLKAVGDGAVMVFPGPPAAIRALLSLPALPPEMGASQRVGVHVGPALATTLNDRLDYFGLTVRQAMLLPGLAPLGGWALSQAIMDEPSVLALLQASGWEGEAFRADLPGLGEAVLHRFGGLAGTGS